MTQRCSLFRIVPLFCGLAWCLGAALCQAPTQLRSLTKEHLPAEGGFGVPLLADVDRDGDADLVLGFDSQDRLYLNDGEGVFRDVTATHMPAIAGRTSRLAAADLDRDGDVDLVLSGWGRQTRLYLNDGRGRFADATAASMPADSENATEIAIGDVDADGDLDLLLAKFRHPSTQLPAQDRLCLNNGQARFTDVTAARLPAIADLSIFAQLVDVDRDGDLDALVGGSTSANKGFCKLWGNDGRGFFTDRSAGLPALPYSANNMSIGDVDADGDVDVVFGQVFRYVLLRGDGKGGFQDDSQASMPPSHASTYTARLVDVDLDRDLDLVAVNRYAPVWIHLNDGTGRFGPPDLARTPDTPMQGDSTHGDVDGDGDPDLVLATYDPYQSRTLRLLVNHQRVGAGWFADASEAFGSPATTFTWPPLLFDADGDRDLDILFGRGLSAESYVLNDGRGRFTEVAATHWPSLKEQTVTMVAADVDGDGDLDVFLGNRPQIPTWPGQHRLLQNDGRGRFTDVTSAQFPVTDSSPESSRAADLDSDGDIDLVISEYLGSTPSLTFFRNDGKGKFTTVSGSLAPCLGRLPAFELADVDRDGDPDLLLAEQPGASNPGRNRLFLNDGRGTFQEVTATHMPADADSSVALAIGDVDADGDADVLVVNWQQQKRLYLNDGSGKFLDATAQRLPVDTHPSIRGFLRDIDDDGDLDLLVLASPEPGLLYLNDGSGRFQAVNARLGPEVASWESGLGDLDGDGDPDLVTDLGALLNHHRQMQTPLLARLGYHFVWRTTAQPGYATGFQLVIPFVATRSAQVAVPPWGVLGLDPTGMIVGSLRVIAPPGGSDETRLLLPAATALAGITLYSQALIIDNLAPHRWRLTNATADVILR